MKLTRAFHKRTYNNNNNNALRLCKWLPAAGATEERRRPCTCVACKKEKKNEKCGRPWNRSLRVVTCATPKGYPSRVRVRFGREENGERALKRAITLCHGVLFPNDFRGRRAHIKYLWRRWEFNSRLAFPPTNNCRSFVCFLRFFFPPPIFVVFYADFRSRRPLWCRSAVNRINIDGDGAYDSIIETTSSTRATRRRDESENHRPR